MASEDLLDQIAYELADFHPSNDKEDREVQAMASRAMAVVEAEVERLTRLVERACFLLDSGIGRLPIQERRSVAAAFRDAAALTPSAGGDSDG